jgi:DnaJ family protein C protein 19
MPAHSDFYLELSVTVMLQGIRRTAVRRFIHVDVQKTTLKAVTGYHQPFSVRNFHQTPKAEYELIIAGLAIGGAGLALQGISKAFDVYAQKKAESAVSQNSQTTPEREGATTMASDATADATDSAESSEAQKQEAAKKRAKASSSNMDAWFGEKWNEWFAKKYYDGGFEEKMTKREAALILGVRESSPPERVKDAHRKIMQINHPDKGGSAYLTAKVNEAKDLLLKGKQ